MAEKVMIEIVDHGIPRDEAHEILRTASFEAIEKKQELLDICLRTPELAAAFSAEELTAMFDPMNHIGFSQEIVDEAVTLQERLSFEFKISSHAIPDFFII